MRKNGQTRRRELVRFLRRQELLITVLLCCLHAALSVWRLGERAVWLLRDYTPLHIPYETEWMIAHEGTILLSSLLSVWTAVGCARLYLTGGRPCVGTLRAAASVHMWAGRLLELVCLAAAAGASWLAYYYRLSVSAVGWIGAAGAVLLFCCVTRVRFWRNIVRIMKDACGRSDDGVTGCLRFQSAAMLAMGLLPVLAVSMEGTLITGAAVLVHRVLPLVTADTIRQAVGSAGSMYATDILRTASGAGACGMVWFLYCSYRASYGDCLTGRLRERIRRGHGEKAAGEMPAPRKDPGRKPWGKGL